MYVMLCMYVILIIINPKKNSLYIYYVILITFFLKNCLWQNTFINLLSSIESTIS